jgi:indolepyruvate ferredoxin oxidoreductase
LDPFGRSPLRRLERQLRDEYEALVIWLSDTLEPESHDRALAIARLPSTVRGYGPVKAAAIRRFWDDLERLCPEWPERRRHRGRIDGGT